VLRTPLSVIPSMVVCNFSNAEPIGSSNLDAGVSVGTIFGIYKIREDAVGKPTVADVLRPGTEMLVAGYCNFLQCMYLTLGMYAASANLVLTTGSGNGVNGFTLDNALGEFILTHPDVSNILYAYSS
jgi:fructose-1,6-bisphosphatase I